eukprot:GEMP01046365.1.p1 GENE.GEMP01046365.1~~GEMP01046365.1.p1  ORF type:complete len:497 (+),score=95.91 GEMP01046365.1:67-1557(+)
MEFVNLNILPTPQTVVEDVDSQAKSFKGYRVVKEEIDSAPVSLCSFAADGNMFAVAHSTRLSVWELNSMNQVHQFERFKDVVTAAGFRADGKLLLAGDASGKTSILNVAGKNALKRLKGHRSAVTCGGFGLLRTNCVTGGKDKTIRYWDVSTAEEVTQWEAHNDSVKCIANSPAEEMVLASGSHDGTVKLWDIRDSASGSDGRKATMTFDHGHPVESICYFPSAMLLLSAGSTVVNVWDLSKGSLVSTFGDSHGRTITSCSVDGKGETCFTTSLDGTAKVYDASTYRMLYSYVLPKPALCGQWSPSGSGFIVGLESGWQARRCNRLNVERAQTSRPKASTARFYKRGKKEKPKEGDTMVDMDRRTKQSSTDYFLRKFEYRKALVACIQEGMEAKVWTFLDEMAQRGSLEKCVKNLDQAQSLSVLQWILRHFPPAGPYRVLFFDFLNTVLDQEAFHRCSSPAVVDMIRRIDMKVNQELSNHTELKPLLGILDSVIVA